MGRSIDGLTECWIDEWMNVRADGWTVDLVGVLSKQAET